MQNKLIDLKDVFIDMEFDCCEDALESLAKELVKSGACKAGFVEAILKREAEFPTGLETESNIGVALPHAEAEHVNENSALVAILKDGLEFRSMGFPENKVNVKLIIMLAISEPEGHLEILQKLSELLTNGELLQKVANSKDKKFLSEVFQKLFA